MLRLTISISNAKVLMLLSVGTFCFRLLCLELCRKPVLGEPERSGGTTPKHTEGCITEREQQGCRE